MENIVSIPRIAYATLARQIAEKAESAAANGHDSVSVDLMADAQLPNGQLLFVVLKGEFLIDVEDVQYPEGTFTEVSRVYPNWWEFGASTDDEDLETTDFSINILMNLVANFV